MSETSRPRLQPTQAQGDVFTKALWDLVEAAMKNGIHQVPIIGALEVLKADLVAQVCAAKEERS